MCWFPLYKDFANNRLQLAASLRMKCFHNFFLSNSLSTAHYLRLENFLNYNFLLILIMKVFFSRFRFAFYRFKAEKRKKKQARET